ncbi:MAG: pyruvate formate lyase-activating protein [Fibrobacter sp.]|nr:pyruvate formate lyase-activating protein [Fibrobacter sp.]
MTTGRIHKLETFGLVDGPGVRCVVFTQGCRMRCRYCHNPETWNCSEGGTLYTPQELFSQVYRYRSYWKNNGGVTVSGGEPLLQLDFLIEFFEICREHNVHTALDTSGNPFQNTPEYLEKFDRLLKSTSIVLLDLKMLDSAGHKNLTRQPNENILEMARYISDKGIPIWVRRVLVPGLTDGDEELQKTYEFIQSLKTVRRVEVLPYHAFAIPKWQELGIPYSLTDTLAPTKKQIKHAEDILHVKDFPDYS